MESVLRRPGINPVGAKKPPIYLDWNSTSPPHPDVLAAMQWAALNVWANPASVHTWGRQARSVVESVRDCLAQLIGASPRDVVFTSSGTEANNWALREAPGLVLSRLEHPSVTRQGECLAAIGRPVRWLEIPQSGQIDPKSVEMSLVGMPAGTCVAVMAVNHETGIIQPIENIVEIVHRAGAWLHVDAVQALGKLPPSSWQHWDSVSLGAHKIRGPKGIGALAWKCGRPIPKPILIGGAQERGLRAGTVDPVMVAGFGAALQRVEQGPTTCARLAPLRDKIESALGPQVERNTADDVTRLGHVASLFVPGWSAEELVAALDLEGICISSGSACAAGTAEISPVLTAMLGIERARSSVRVSLGETTTDADIQQAIGAFRVVLSRP